jgi:signal transduction histidine kinase
LNDALRQEEQVAVADSTPEQREYLKNSMAQFWDAVDRTFAVAASGNPDEARTQIQVSLQARQSALSTAVARLLVQNNESEEQAALRIAQIYDRVQRQVYLFLTLTLVAILLTGLYSIRSNRQLFAQLAALSAQRSELAQKLISTQESTLRHISRELHDEFGQILTAVGAMLSRAGNQVPEGSSLRADLPVVERQAGIHISYEKSGTAYPVDGNAAIHVYRVVQEALNNVTRHSGAREAWVRLRYLPKTLELEVEDHGSGFVPQSAKQGIGLVAMRERAQLLGGAIDFSRPAPSGTLIRLTVPREKMGEKLGEKQESHAG